MVSMAAMKEEFICTKLRRMTMKLSMMNTSCRRPMTAARPEARSKRMAMYTSISTEASTTLQTAFFTSVLPATGPT